MSALPARERPSPGWHGEAEWAQIEAAAPRVAAVMCRYLRQLGTFLAPRSVDAADSALRQLARWMVTEAGLTAAGDIRRDDIEDYKVWLAAQPRAAGRTITAETHRQRMRTVRQFFERIIEWDWPGAPPRNPVIAWDIPKKPEPLPKFLDDRDAARLIADQRGPLDRHVIGRIVARVARVARAAGVPGVHPHRLRHTLATQAINRGMRLEAIAALLGHQEMEMTLIYAKIANRVAADEYAAVSAKTGALYGQPPQLPAGYETTGMARLRREAHARMLGNGLCTRPAELGCRMESACETCAYFRTGTELLPILVRQRDHARGHGQAERAALFGGLIQRAQTERS